MHLNTIFLLLAEGVVVQSSTYIIRRTNILESVDNWNNGDIPCEDDWIRFDAEKITTVLIDGGLKVSAIDLPNDGIVFFGEKMELGKLGKWQCKKRPKPEGKISVFR